MRLERRARLSELLRSKQKRYFKDFCYILKLARHSCFIYFLAVLHTTSIIIIKMAIATATATVGDDIVDSIDTTLLRGLEPVLSVAEQRYITTLLTSGNPNDVAAAAKMLYEVGFAIYHADPSESIRRSFATSTEIFTTHHFDEHHTKKNYYTHRRPAYNDYENRVAQEKKEAVYQQERTATALPLPVRMPRYVKKKAT